MENNFLSKSTIGFGLSLVIISIFNGLLVILKESVPPVMDWMKDLTGHHWITHGVFDILLFIILGYFLSKMDLQQKITAEKLSNLIIWSTIIGSLLIIGFILIH